MEKEIKFSLEDETAVSALKMIETVKRLERAAGLTNEEIKIKYTLGGCSSLASAIRMTFGACFGKEINSFTFSASTARNGKYATHTCVDVGKGLFVDINGLHTANEVKNFLDSGYFENEEIIQKFEENKLTKFALVDPRLPHLTDIVGEQVGLSFD